MADDPSSSDRRRVPDRRALARGGRRITDLTTHPDAYVTIPDFAQHLMVQQRTVRKWIRGGVLKAACFQGEWRIHTAEAIAFVERNQFQVGGKKPA
jgi:helix-turn-helix protein